MAGELPPPGREEVIANIGALPHVGEAPALSLGAANAALVFLKENNPALFAAFEEAKRSAIKQVVHEIFANSANPATNPLTHEGRVVAYISVIGNIVGATIANAIGQTDRDTAILHRMFEGSTRDRMSKSGETDAGGEAQPPAA